eukprot:m51a1_g8107 putative poly rna polymerase cid11-like (457) ;mRNA; f:108093-109780
MSEPTVLHVAGLPAETAEEDLRILFVRRPVQNVFLSTVNPRGRRFAFVTLASAADARAALEQLAGSKVLGELIKLSPSRTAPSSCPTEALHSARYEAANTAGEERPHESMPQSLRDLLEAELVGRSHQLRAPADASAPRRELIDAVRSVLAQTWPDVTVLPFGSFATGLYSGEAQDDLDVCVVVDARTREGEPWAEHGLLVNLQRRLTSSKCMDPRNIELVSDARVPILRARGPGVFGVDISVNRTLGRLNSKLVRAYVQQDKRAETVIRAARRWARVAGLGRAQRLSSYALTLMCISFLQRHAPPVLPNFQGPDCPGATRGDYAAEGPACFWRDPGDHWRSPCRACAGELFVALLYHYGWEFDWAQHAVCVRAGRAVLRDSLLWETSGEQQARPPMCVVDPFEVKFNTTRAVVGARFHEAVAAFRHAYATFCDVATSKGPREAWDALLGEADPAQ